MLTEGSSIRTVGQLLETGKRLSRGEPTTESERREYMEASEAFRIAIHGIFRGLSQGAQSARPLMVDFTQGLRDFANSLKQIEKQVEPIIRGMLSEFEKLPEKLQIALIRLGRSGWYLDGEMEISDAWRFEAMLAAGKSTELDELLANHFRARLTAIELELCAALAHRSKILKSAFAAHHREEYELSIPVLLAQSDGVCQDLTGKFLFLRERGRARPQIASHIEAKLPKFSAAILSPLLTVLPINENEGERRARALQGGDDPENWSTLNRHLVLHGVSLDYSTELNSLKAISLLNYLACFLQAVDRRTATEAFGADTSESRID